MSKILKTLTGLWVLISVQIAAANTLLVIADHSRDLDYFIDLTQYPFLMDMDELKEQFNKESDKRLIYVRIYKQKKPKMTGEFIVMGLGKKRIRKFKNYKQLSNLYMDFLTGPTDLILFGHTISDEKLKKFLPTTHYKFETIMTSACKMGTISKLNIFGKYTDIVLASPENVHLSHFEHTNIINTMTGAPIEKAMNMSQISFERILRFTRSNLVLNIYDTSQPIKKDICESQSDLRSILIDQKIKLSIFERRQLNDNQFILKDCKRRQ